MMSAVRPMRLHARPAPSSKPPVLFVHGVYHGAWAFEDAESIFHGAGYPVHRIDLRGHGGERRVQPNDPIGFGDYQADVRTALDSVAGMKIVVGHSLGGLLALSLAARPDVAALVLMAVPLPDVLRATTWRLLLRFPLRVLRFAWTGDATVLYHEERFVNHYLLSRYTPPNIAAHALARIRQQQEPAQLFREIMRLRLPSLPDGLPCLVVSGADDPTVTQAAAERLKRLTNGAHIHVLNCGHDIMLEESAGETWCQVLRWIDEAVRVV